MTKEEKAKYYADECYPYNHDMQFQCECHFEKGWDEAIKSLWIIPNDKSKIPIYKDIKQLGFVALLKNGETIFQKNLSNFYWNDEDKKFVYNYTEVLAWMNIPKFETIKR